MNGAQVIAEILKREGTEFLSCYPRNQVIEPCAALDIRPVLCRQERVGVGLADGYSRIKRGKRNGVFAAQAGPGIENAFPGVAQAYAENVPLLIVSGGLALAKQYVRPAFRAAEVYKPVTKWSALAHNVQELPDLMRRAYHAMRSGKAGPVLIEVPDEVFEAEFKGDARLRAGAGAALGARSGRGQEGRADAAGREEPDPVGRAGRALRAKPASSSRRWPSCCPRRWSPPIRARARSPENHPLSLGASTRSRGKPYTDFMAKADLVFAVGSSLTKTPFGPGVPPGKTIVHSTNDAGDINKEYRADHAVVGDAALVLDALIAEVSRQKGPGGGNAFTSLKEEVATAKKAWLDEWAKFLNSDETPLNQYRVIRDLMKTVDRNNVIMTHDSGQPARADDAVLGADGGGLLHGLGQVHPARLRARHHHGRQARRAEQALRQRDGRRRHRHDRHGHRDRGAQPHRHPHRGVQQRRDGRRARRAEDLRREVRLDDGRRQLHQGGRGPERRGAPRREARRYRSAASRRRSA